MLKRRPSLPFVERWRDRHGKMRFYFRRRGSPRIALTGEFGSDEFHAAYARALHGGASDDTRPKIERPGNGTLAALIASYKQDAAFTRSAGHHEGGLPVAARRDPARAWRAFGRGSQPRADRNHAGRL